MPVRGAGNTKKKEKTKERKKKYRQILLLFSNYYTAVDFRWLSKGSIIAV